jgi:predicted phage gp36 major capsid-like protein
LTSSILIVITVAAQSINSAQHTKNIKNKIRETKRKKKEKNKKEEEKRKQKEKKLFHFAQINCFFYNF